MPKILSLDTSTEACSVALILPCGEISENYELAAQSHTQRLLPMLDDMLVQHGLQVADLDAIAFSAGPGSFTGIRIGMGVVQGLAFAGQIPVIPVSTLQAQALDLGEAHPERDILSALDARMGEVYYAFYRYDLSCARLQVMQEAMVSSPADLSLPEAFDSATALGVGQGFTLESMLRYVASADASVRPRASAVARLALDAWQRGDLHDVMTVEPNYIRDTVTWKKRERIRR